MLSRRIQPPPPAAAETIGRRPPPPAAHSPAAARRPPLDGTADLAVELLRAERTAALPHASSRVRAQAYARATSLRRRLAHA
jgi:hypothetical protein